MNFQLKDSIDIILKQKGSCNGIACEYCALSSSASGRKFICDFDVYDYKSKMNAAKTLLIKENFKLLC